MTSLGASIHLAMLNAVDCSSDDSPVLALKSRWAVMALNYRISVLRDAPQGVGHGDEACRPRRAPHMPSRSILLGHQTFTWLKH